MTCAAATIMRNLLSFFFFVWNRHEIALQTLSEQGHLDQPTEQTEEGEQDTTEEPIEYVEEEAVDNDLTLVQQDLNQTTVMTQPDMTQQTILTQAGLHDALGLTTTNIDQQLLNQQV